MTANRIVQHIFQQPDIKQVDEAALERLVTSYPYFTAGRLLLARKQYTLQKNLLAPAVKKAQQYSNNMHYFYRFVTTDEKSLALAEAPEVTAPEEAPVVASIEETPVAAVHAAPAESEVPFTPATTAPVEEQPQAVAPVTTTAAPIETVETPAAPAAEVNIPEPVATSSAQPAPPETMPEVPVAHVAPVAEVHASEPVAAAPVQPVASETAPEAPEASVAPVAAQHPVEAPLENAIPVAPAEAPVTTATTAPEAKIHVTVPKTPAVAPESNEEEQIDVTANDVVATTAAPAEAPATEAPVQQPSAAEEKSTATEEPIKIFPLDTTETETSLTFQPLYSDDYFAYKRLKEPESAEKLSEKAAAEMKSFTSWLRDLKSTFAEKAATKQWYQEQMHRSYEDADPGVSETVEKMAMESITLNDDLVTETLAEVWAHQRQYLTAIHIYQKLSLLNPNKSAYFAQKIKEIQLLTEKS